MGLQRIPEGERDDLSLSLRNYNSVNSREAMVVLVVVVVDEAKTVGRVWIL